ncbi:hypothetical protein IMY05_002G0022000 [Salix suchowensis]|nr:hypothetical protein IMY05_002G0022000 [Salix suchowensis]
MSSDCTEVLLKGPKELDNCCSFYYLDRWEMYSERLADASLGVLNISGLELLKLWFNSKKASCFEFV